MTKTYNRAAPAMQALPQYLKDIIMPLSDDEWAKLAGAMHGARISSGMTTQQIDLYNRLVPFITDLEHIDGVFDYVAHTSRIYADSKSEGYDGNTPVKYTAQKYLDVNQEGYDMYFIMSADNTGGWPTHKFKEYGITIVTETQFKELIHGKKK